MAYDITFWYGIRKNFLSKERLIEAKECGFTVIECPYDKETNKQVLKWCEELGLKANVQDNRFAIALEGKPGWEKAVDEIVADYSGFPALNRFFIRDEPTDDYFPTLGRVAKYLHKADPKHSEYINLLPLIAVMPYDKYQKHVEDYLNEVEPRILSYDHYNLMKKEVEDPGNLPLARVSKENRERNGWENKIFVAEDRETFYDNLEIIKEAAKRHNIPWMIIVLVVEHWHYRWPTEAEIRAEAFTAMTYGSTELSYFTYWTPGSDNTEPWSYHHGMINVDGTRDEQYYVVKKINSELQAFYKGITEKAPFDREAPGKFSHEEVFHVGRKEETETLVKYFEPYGLYESVEGEALIAGFFKNGRMMVTNKNHRADAKVEIKTKGTLYMLDKESGEWKKSDGKVKIAAGSAELFAASED